jgi:glycosyltransferase involved in cell wall biosynthesis
MPGHPDLAIFVDDWGYQEYLEPYVTAITGERGLNCVREPELNIDAVARTLATAKVVWFDGLSDHLLEITKAKRTDKCLAICRLRNTEILELGVDECRWEFFDRIVVANPIVADLLRDRFDRIDSHCDIRVLPPAIQIPDVELHHKRKTRRLVYVGRISASQNAFLLLQCLAALVQQHRDWRLFITGEFENFSLRVYFEQMIAAMGLGENIEFNPIGSELTAWFADKSYYLAPYASTGQELYVYRAMTYGLRPLVHNYFGADQMFETKSFFSTIREFGSMAEGNGYRPLDYQRYVTEKHNVQTLLPAFQELLAPVESGRVLPKVSVLIPTYNRARLLEKLLNKLGNQTYTNREIVVVDDCSSDDTESTVKKIMATRTDIVLYRNEVNQGNAATTGIAASKATGDYLLVCSDDDELTDNALQQMVRHASMKKADLVYCDLEIVDSEGKTTAVWAYRDYYTNHELLRALINSGRNLIPEVFMVRRELFEKLYTETYARRFLNTYYVPMLRELRMSHLSAALYRYAIHQGSTFSSTTGLLDRSKSTQNFINAVLFMYSPDALLGNSEGSPADQIAAAYSKAALILVEHGKNQFSGKMYTGVRFELEDHLFKLHFYNAYHWLEMARRYGLPLSEYNRLLDVILAIMNPREFDPARDANMPAFYRCLPWFANKPFNNLSQFVALDMVTIGAAPYLAEREYTVHREGKEHVWVCNYPLADAQNLDQVMSTNAITVINLFDRKAIEPTLRYLADRHLFSVYVLNFTSFSIPPMEMLRNIINVRKCTCDHFDDYLLLLTKLTTTEHYAHPHLQTVS